MKGRRKRRQNDRKSYSLGEGVVSVTYLRTMMTMIVITAARKTKPPNTARAMIPPMLSRAAAIFVCFEVPKPLELSPDCSSRFPPDGFRALLITLTVVGRRLLVVGVCRCVDGVAGVVLAVTDF